MSKSQDRFQGADVCVPQDDRKPLAVNLKMTDSIPKGGNKICSDGCDKSQILFWLNENDNQSHYKERCFTGQDT